MGTHRSWRTTQGQGTLGTLLDRSDETWSFKKRVLTHSVNPSNGRDGRAVSRPVAEDNLGVSDLHPGPPPPKSKAEFKAIGPLRGLWPSHPVFWGPLLRPRPNFAYGAWVLHLSPSRLPHQVPLTAPEKRNPSREGQSPVVSESPLLDWGCHSCLTTAPPTHHQPQIWSFHKALLLRSRSTFR